MSYAMPPPTALTLNTLVHWPHPMRRRASRNRGQCNLSPAAAAASWANIMARFGSSRLVSPATAGAGIPWLTQFIGNCSLLYGPSGCRLQYVAVHDYSCTPASTMAYLEEVYAAFKLPVWLTEFSCGDGRDNKSQAANLAFMKAVFPLLDAAEHVYRWGHARVPYRRFLP